MPLVPTNIQSQQNIRETNPELDKVFEALDIPMPDEAPAMDVDDNGIITITNPDGSITFEKSQDKAPDTLFEGHNENIADLLEEMDLCTIAEDILEGIAQDISDRSEFEEVHANAIKLLGLKKEEASEDTGSISKVYHPLILEACIRYQANFRGEMLPASGPVKVSNNSDKIAARDIKADNLENDLNHYLTVTAKEYYPDTDRMSFSQALMGSAFRKGYHCALRGRPVLEFIPAYDLIVSSDAVSLSDATRVTHRYPMRQSVMKRMQFLKVFRDVDLQTPNQPEESAPERVADSVQGVITSNNSKPEDISHEIYETIVDLDIPGYEDPNGLLLPYKVCIEKTSRTVLSIRRYWAEGDETYTRLNRIVKYPFVPWLKFYDLGFGHILGNTARGLTAIMRQLLDAGQFSNFPGFLISAQGPKQKTTQIRAMPGQGVEIQTGDKSIRDVVMDMPYKGPSAELANYAGSIAADARNLAGTAELPVGEGKADIPVGTMIALVEQATKVVGAIHKRNHTAQKEEFEVLKELFAEDPTALSRHNKESQHKWSTAEEFEDKMLVPASDPNIPSHMHRVMIASALVQRADAKPELYNVKEVEKRALRIIGVDDIDSLITPDAPPGAAPQMGPKMMEIMAQAQAREKEQKMEMAQDLQRGRMKAAETQMDAAIKQKELESKMKIAEYNILEKMLEMGAITPDQVLQAMLSGDIQLGNQAEHPVPYQPNPNIPVA